MLVDEFQDTDPVQWEVLDRAFDGQATLVLIGDPKQAIYAFRGGDIVTYLAGREHGRRARPSAPTPQRRAAGRRLSRGARAAPRSATPDIVVRDVHAHHAGHRLAGAPHNDPFRLRVVTRDAVRASGTGRSRWTRCADIAADLAADVQRAAGHRRDVRRPPGRGR